MCLAVQAYALDPSEEEGFLLHGALVSCLALDTLHWQRKTPSSAVYHSQGKAVKCAHACAIMVCELICTAGHLGWASVKQVLPQKDLAQYMTQLPDLLRLARPPQNGGRQR